VRRGYKKSRQVEAQEKYGRHQLVGRKANEKKKNVLRRNNY